MNQEASNRKNVLRTLFFGVVVFLFSVLQISCQGSVSEDSSQNEFQIHITKALTLIEWNQNEPFDVLHDADYVIRDDQITSYDWGKQLLVLDDSVKDLYVSDLHFLFPLSDFAVLWNGEVLAQGEVVDIGSPVVAYHPVLHVLEPVGDPNYPTRRLISSGYPEFSSVRDFSILLRVDRGPEPVTLDGMSETIFDDSVAEEIREHFRQDGRSID